MNAIRDMIDMTIRTILKPIFFWGGFDHELWWAQQKARYCLRSDRDWLRKFEEVIEEGDELIDHYLFESDKENREALACSVMAAQEEAKKSYNEIESRIGEWIDFYLHYDYILS